jgi:hypothetical protein
MFSNNLLMGAASISAAGGYEIAYSCRFNRTDAAYLSKTYSGGDGNLKKFVYSGWIKRGVLGHTDDGTLLSAGVTGTGNYESIGIMDAGDADAEKLYWEIQAGGGTTYGLLTPAVLRDPHAWYHICVAKDTTQGTAINRVRIWINGVQQTLTTKYTSQPTENSDGIIGDNTYVHYFSKWSDIAQYYDGYFSQTAYLDDLAITDPITDSLIEKDDNGVIRPVDISSLDFGVTGVLLDYADNTDLGNDISGNNNDFTSSGLASNDQMIDTPTNNHATLTPLWTGGVLSNGNLKVVSTGGAYQWAISSIAIPDSGKWVCEFQSSNIDGSSKYGYVGICQMGSHAAANGNNYIYGLNLGTGEFVKNGSVQSGTITAPTTSLIRVEYDVDADTIEFFDDGSSVHSATMGLSGQSSLNFWCAPYGSGADITTTFASLTGTPTTDFITLSTTNLAVPSIADPSIYAQAYNYTGTGSAHTETLSGNSDLGTLDMLVLKNFSTTDQPRLFAAHSEMGDDKAILMADSAAMETNTNGVTSIGDANAFTLGTGAGGFNDDGKSFSSYCFHVAKTAEDTNNEGSIASKVIVNGSAGWSIGTWEGTEANATIGHGLSIKPNFLLISSLDDAGEAVRLGFTSLGWTKNIGFTGAIPVPYTDATAFQDTAPTASVFSVGSNAALNDSGGTMFFFAAYDIAGFSTWGYTYAPTGNLDGPLAFYGFNAEFIWLMRVVGATVWSAIDIIRDPYNQTESAVRINDNTAGTTSNVDMDILSNGLKIRNSGGNVNDVGANFYIMACAKNPFGGHGGTFGGGVSPATAR